MKFMCHLPLVCIGFLLIIEVDNAYPFICLSSPTIVGFPQNYYSKVKLKL